MAECYVLQAQEQLRMYKEELAKKQRLIEQLTMYDMIVNFHCCVIIDTIDTLSLSKGFGVATIVTVMM